MPALPAVALAKAGYRIPDAGLNLLYFLYLLTPEFCILYSVFCILFLSAVLRLSSTAKAPYSERRLFTGLAKAALIAWKLTVINAIIRAAIPATTNIHQLIEIL